MTTPRDAIKRPRPPPTRSQATPLQQVCSLLAVVAVLAALGLAARFVLQSQAPAPAPVVLQRQRQQQQPTAAAGGKAGAGGLAPSPTAAAKAVTAAVAGVAAKEIKKAKAPAPKSDKGEPAEAASHVHGTCAPLLGQAGFHQSSRWIWPGLFCICRHPSACTIVTKCLRLTPPPPATHACVDLQFRHFPTSRRPRLPTTARLPRCWTQRCVHWCMRTLACTRMHAHACISPCRLCTGRLNRASCVACTRLLQETLHHHLNVCSPHACMCAATCMCSVAV